MSRIRDIGLHKLITRVTNSIGPQWVNNRDFIKILIFSDVTEFLFMNYMTVEIVAIDKDKILDGSWIRHAT